MTRVSPSGRTTAVQTRAFYFATGPFICAAKASAISSAMDRVFAKPVFDVTATTSPRSGNVRREAVPPMKSGLVP